MARRGRMRSIPLATFAAATAATAQLGLGYGLGIIAWVPPDGPGPTAGGAWTASLAWASWIAATSVVIGAVVGERYTAKVPSGRFARIATRVAVALGATLGGLVVIPLIGVPASRAQIVDNYAPHLLAGIFAAIGIVAGLVVALVAVAARAVAANVIVSAVWLWTLAIIALVDGPAGDSAGFGQLAVWKFTDTGPMWRSYYIPGVLLMLGAALLIGGLAAFPAAGRGERRLGVAISGAAGPLLVAVAYILASPQAGTAPDEQVSAYATAPFMIVAGLAGSLLVAAVGGPPRRRKAKAAADDDDVLTALARADDPAPYPAQPTYATVTGKASVPASSRIEVGI